MGAKKWKDEKSGVELTIKERDFASMYVFGKDGEAGNATECFRRVYKPDEGMSLPMLYHHAHKLMKNKRVKEAIKNYFETAVSKESVLGVLKGISTNKESKDADRVRATELLGKAQGLFVDKSEVNIKTDAIFEEEA